MVTKVNKNITTIVLEKSNTKVAEEIWKKLEKEINQVHFANTWEWTNTWLAHFGDTVDWWFVVGEKDSKPCAITLVTKEKLRKLPFPVATLHIGTHGEPLSETVTPLNNSILAKKDIKFAFYKELIKTLKKNFTWEEIIFDNINETDANILEDFLSNANHHFVTHKETCLYLNLADLKNKKSTVLETLGPNTKRSIKVTQKMLGENITVEEAKTSAQAHEFLQELIDLYQNTWNKRGIRGMFVSTRFHSFHKELLKKQNTEKIVKILRVKSKVYGTIGVVYYLLENGTIYTYQQGIQDFPELKKQTSRFRPGFLVHVLCQEYLLNLGIDAYNFSTGFYPYKTLLTDKQMSITTISIRRGIKPFAREKIMHFHYQLLHWKWGKYLLKPLYLLTK